MDINSILANEVNKNAVVNTFTKGMNTDTSDSMMPSDQYRIAYNLRLITNNSENNGELSTIEGYSYVGDQFVDVAAATQIRQYGIVVDRKEAPENPISVVGGQEIMTLPSEEWSIYTIVKDGDQYDVTRIFGPCDDPLGDAVSLVTRYEDDDNVKLYIADGKHPLMMINIADPANASQPSTNISTISSFPEHQFKSISLSQLSSGSLLPAAVQYAYVLYNKYGNNSGLSPLSNLVPVVNRSSGSSKGLEYGDKSGAGYKITISENKTSGFNKCCIYRITYQQVGQDPTVNMIYDGDLNASSNFIYDDYGANIQSLSYAELLALQKIPVIFTEIESKNDYLFASNIKYQINNSQDLLQTFNNLDLTAQITDSNYLNMSSRYDDWTWRGYDELGHIISWELKENTGNSGKALRHNELYRFGIVLYDMYGNAWPVKWICDVRTPIGNTCFTVVSGGTEINDYTDNKEPTQLSIEFTIDLQLLQSRLGEFADYFKNFEIVRCKRDDTRHVISRGIIGRPLQCYKYASGSDYELDTTLYTPKGEDTKVLVPSGFFTTSKMVVYPGSESDYTYGISSSRFALFASPEICYQEDDIKNLLNSRKGSLELQTVYKYQGILEYSKRTEHYGTNDVYYIPTTPSSTKDVDSYYIGSGVLNNIYTGLNFSKSRFDRDNGDMYTIPSAFNDKGILWISTRHFYPYHEPLAYQQKINNSTDKQQCAAIDGSTYYDVIDLDRYDKIGLYYRDANNVNIRKTIYNRIAKDLNQPVIDISYSVGSEGYNDNNAWPLSNKIKTVYDFIFPNIPKYYEFSEDNTPTFRNNSSNLNGYEFIPWSIPTNYMMQDFSGYYGARLPKAFNAGKYWQYDSDYDEEVNYYPVSTVGKSVLLDIGNSAFGHDNYADLHITVCDLCNNNDGDRYGGYTDYARRNSTYYSFGDYYPLTANSGNDIKINITSGDCYLRMFYYNAAKTFYTDKAKFAPNMTTVYQIPIETDIEINYETGHSAKNQGAGDNMFIQDDAASLRGYTQEKPCYIANTAYNTNETAKYFTGTDEDDLKNVNYDYRVCYSNQKQNNESFDSWLSFKSANYIDVDTRYGQITNLRLFKDTLLFWQDNAVGVLSVNERTIIQDANDTNIVLGNGDVLQRYDYLTTEYGMKPNQYVDCQSNTTLYWWDGYRKEILSYSGGQSVTPMNKL